MAEVIADAGPLVAYLDHDEEHHGWAVEQFSRLTSPLLTCEAVWAEVSYLTTGMAPERLFGLLRRGIVRLSFSLDGHWPRVEAMMKSYADVPMSLADGCLVAMSELQERSVVLTLDRDFLIYRRHRRQKIPLLAPFAG